MNFKFPVTAFLTTTTLLACYHRGLLITTTTLLFYILPSLSLTMLPNRQNLKICRGSTVTVAAFASSSLNLTARGFLAAATGSGSMSE
jgi:hypothetical protein